MANLVYFTIASLDGYIEDESGKFDWAQPDEEVHAFVNEIERPHGTYLLGRRMYETLAYWEAAELLDDDEEVVRGYAEVWRSKDKVVFSSTLEEPRTERTRIEREFDPEDVRLRKESAEADLSIGGPQLAAQALRAGLVDEYRVILVPVAVGAGKASLPPDLRVDLELLDERRFTGGSVYLRYGIRR